VLIVSCSSDIKAINWPCARKTSTSRITYVLRIIEEVKGLYCVQVERFDSCMPNLSLSVKLPVSHCSIVPRVPSAERLTAQKM
jgi:hypothetical protein